MKRNKLPTPAAGSVTLERLQAAGEVIAATVPWGRGAGQPLSAERAGAGSRALAALRAEER